MVGIKGVWNFIVSARIHVVSGSREISYDKRIFEIWGYRDAITFGN